jgi:hypothetical protein
VKEAMLNLKKIFLEAVFLLVAFLVVNTVLDMIAIPFLVAVPLDMSNLLGLLLTFIAVSSVSDFLQDAIKV